MKAFLFCTLVLATASILSAGAESDRCIEYNHDGTFEFEIAWSDSGVQAPYYGAFGEAYWVDSGLLNAVVLWLTQDGTYQGQSLDLYVWEGGYCDEPLNVLWVEPGLQPQDLPVWPEVGENYYPVEVFVYYDCTVGYWGNWPGQAPGFFVAVDETPSESGHPWTHIAPGLPYPSGWQHPDVVWDRRHCESLGLGIDVDRQPSPAEAPSWGSIKSLFR
ncbi:MAG: hypothetical protein GF330_14120 [Candidatus Eisenbacteria bacterium]|nr:hypothetical protein [Candidatus Eisenbacteria bacterium]